MADCKRKSLLPLSSNRLLQIPSNIVPVSVSNTAQLIGGDVEGCFDHIHTFMYSKNLLEVC